MKTQDEIRRDAVRTALGADLNLVALANIPVPAFGEDLVLSLRAHLGSGDMEAAERDFLRLGTLPPGSPAETDAGNFMFLSGRIPEAFERYENAIRPEADPASAPDRLRASVWRELALSRFGDLHSPARLERLAETASARNETRLSALSYAFSLSASVLLGILPPEGTAGRFLSAPEVLSERGPRALARAAALLLGAEENWEEVVEDCLACEGIAGGTDVLSRFYEGYAADISHHPRAREFAAWMENHVHPVLEYRSAEEEKLFPDLPDSPWLRPMNCADCDGRCCYDGVYLTREEEERIKGFVDAHPESFRHVPDPFAEEGEWGFLFGGPRTLRRPQEFLRSDFPSHFTRTKCVFALPSGECSLQAAATEAGYHPWKFKPTSCWEFPLIGLFNEDALQRPHYFGVPDPGYCDEKNPGYVSFMPCARTYPSGISWKTVYKNELQWFLRLKRAEGPEKGGKK